MSAPREHVWRLIGSWFPWAVCWRCGLARLKNEATRRTHCHGRED